MRRRRSHPLHREAAELLGRIDQRGEQLLGQAQGLLRERKTLEGRDLLRQVAEGFYGRPAGTQALRMLQEMEKDPQVQAAVQAARDEASAKQALLMAQQAMVEQRYADAQRLYGMIGEVYPRTEAAGKARQGLANLRKDKAAATQLAQQKAEPEAPVLLGLAARYAQMGRNEEARRHYQRVLQVAPGTTYARQAQGGLLPAAAAGTRGEGRGAARGQVIGDRRTAARYRGQQLLPSAPSGAAGNSPGRQSWVMDVVAVSPVGAAGNSPGRKSWVPKPQ